VLDDFPSGQHMAHILLADAPLEHAIEGMFSKNQSVFSVSQVVVSAVVSMLVVILPFLV
jgi:hypothetical protein